MKLNFVSITGGLGNQMFQYAFFLSSKYVFFSRDCNNIFVSDYNYHNGFELNKIFNIRNNIFLNFKFRFIKKYFNSCIYVKTEKQDESFEQIIEKNNKSVVWFIGYWQSEKYFIKIEDKIRSTFKFNFQKVSNKNKNLILEIEKNNAISIHIRRGDYESDPASKSILGGICNLDYYKRAINYFNENTENPVFYIFSDDIEWVKMNFSFLNSRIIIDWNKKEDNWQDMMLMSKCNHNIIANSSFSWWGAWLNNNPDKIIIAPKKWFNTFDSTDIVPSNWIRM